MSTVDIPEIMLNNLLVGCASKDCLILVIRSGDESRPLQAVRKALESRCRPGDILILAAHAKSVGDVCSHPGFHAVYGNIMDGQLARVALSMIDRTIDVIVVDAGMANASIAMNYRRLAGARTRWLFVNGIGDDLVRAVIPGEVHQVGEMTVVA